MRVAARRADACKKAELLHRYHAAVHNNKRPCHHLTLGLDSTHKHTSNLRDIPERCEVGSAVAHRDRQSASDNLTKAERFKILCCCNRATSTSLSRGEHCKEVRRACCPQWNACIHTRKVLGVRGTALGCTQPCKQSVHQPVHRHAHRRCRAARSASDRTQTTPYSAELALRKRSIHWPPHLHSIHQYMREPQHQDEP